MFSQMDGRSVAAIKNVSRGSWVVDDNVLQHNSLSLHIFSHIQHDSSDGWKHGLNIILATRNIHLNMSTVFNLDSLKLNSSLLSPYPCHLLCSISTNSTGDQEYASVIQMCKQAYIITDYMGIRNESFMKLAAVGTWMGDFVTAWMVTDMMLQDKPYPDWGKSARAFWKKGNVRITLFWTVLFTLTSVVVLVITTDWISWDKLNRGFLPSDEVSRAFLASFILVFDLLIVMQDWEFPHFMGDVDVNLPGLHTPHMQFKIPFFQKIFKEEYRIHITGKWFNYGIIFLVLILDLNMWKNQIFYKPHEYGQYIGPGQKIYTVKDSESLKDLNRTKLSWEWRSNHTNPRTNKTYVEGDMFLHSRFIGASLDVKCLAFVPSLIAFVWFGFFIWFFGRFLKNEPRMENQDKTYTRMKRKSPSEHSKDMGITRENTQASVEDPLNDPSLVCIRSDFNEIVYKSSHLTSENLSSQLNESTSATEADQDPTTSKSTPTN
ncbi:PREDICTED: transmembrane protein 117 isoform X3 [Rhinopithecus bieti]|uniref:transmembrane protein 117 isoform X3 n=1 Tax=Rhinopithecus bieti TaxID=61621 RepID=UPI00083BF3B1|nr:PREDICTED: transmembrane protein 117 isoform X3 [Rhinopithecus bieti]